MSIRLRLTLWYSTILGATLLLFGVGLYIFLHYSYFSSLEEDLQSQAASVESRIQPRLAVTLNGLSVDLVLEGRDYLRSGNTFFQVVNLGNGRISKSANLEMSDVELPKLDEKRVQRLAQKVSYFETVKVDDMRFLVYSSPLFVAPGGVPQLAGVMQAAIFLEPHERFFIMMRWILAVTALATIILAGTVGWFLARKALRPIDQVIAAANQIENGTDLEKRIEYHGPGDEIGRLTSTINGMLGRIQGAYTELEEAYRTQRRFVSDASHELRTPLTTIRGNVELLEKMWKQASLQAPAGSPEEDPKLALSLEAMHDIAGEAERMSRLVGDLLSLARADAGVQMAKSEVAMDSLMEEIARKAQMLPRTVEWQVGDLTAAEGVQVFGNEDYLKQLLFIFIENAFKYTDEGYVRLDTMKSATQIGIRISDTGIGMDKEEVPHIFERFYRADVSRGKKAGTGLGLSIAKWIIDEHHGSIEVKTRKGEGSTFVIWLPVSQGSRIPGTVINVNSLSSENRV
ncbi:HAMP domain-containing sensor histidine kinase [Paenibacillus sp. GD4]|uniref:sensor histidine kinase n=1 Tax=Paenibacillus sp. GD4 TaxID=3068890 RepID=UPI00279648E2|nr:HAMP domain-containing sensor histidine kinase [Paenibacillus sp. GD4]MDQ1910152.1 HAMP domain-containing sensor histidine kinase [Paenibacillus sp. GD4]